MPVTEDTLLPLVQFWKATPEMEALRRLEAHYQRENEALDRVQRALVGAHPGNLVIMVGMPPGSWASLPIGWQTHTQLSVTPQWPPIPWGIKGPVAVSIELAREMIK